MSITQRHELLESHVLVTGTIFLQVSFDNHESGARDKGLFVVLFQPRCPFKTLVSVPWIQGQKL